MRLSADYRQLARIARKSGWKITLTRSGHIAWLPPSGELIITSGSPSDVRAFRNHRAALRRSGLRV